jgi:drug/metabolite transporter (DMT)-like permease
MQQYNYQTIEPRHHWIWIGGAAAILMGLMFFALGGWQGVLLGLAALVAGGATLWVSSFGAKWNSLSGVDKAKVLPGVIFGILVIVCAIIAYFFLRWFWNRK